MLINGKWYTEPQLQAYIRELHNILRETKPVLKAAIYADYKDQNKADELYDKITKIVGRE